MIVDFVERSPDGVIPFKTFFRYDCENLVRNAELLSQLPPTNNLQEYIALSTTMLLLPEICDSYNKRIT